MKRRTALRLGAGIAAAGLAGCGTGEYDGPRRPLRIAAGEPGGFYVEVAELLADQLGAVEPDLPAEVISTGGSVANLELLAERRADLGLVLSDVATSAADDGASFLAIGRMYENYMQLVVAGDSPIQTVADLAGRRISLGANGSGAAMFGDRLLGVTGVAAVVDHRPLTEAVAELAAGRIDALLWSGGVPTPALVELHERRPVRLIPLAAQLRALREAYGAVYDQVVVPAGGYGGAAPPSTIGVPNLLVCDQSLPDDVVGAVTTVLVRRAPRLVPPQALGTQYLDQRSLIVTGAVPMHPGAAAAYRDLRG